MMTNGINHNLKIGQLVWSLTGRESRIFKVAKIGAKRITCYEVGFMNASSGLVIDINSNESHSLHSPENLVEVEKHIKPTYKSFKR